MTLTREQIEAIRAEWTRHKTYSHDLIDVLCDLSLEALELRAENERLRIALHNVIDAADSFKDDDGYEVAAQVKIRARAALERKEK